MNRSRFGDLEVLCRTLRPGPRTPLLFVHGAYTAAWCWDENFLPWFAEQGYAPTPCPCRAMAQPRAGLPRQLRRYVAEVADKLPAPPVLIGHSMGGMVVQKYLEKHTAPAVVLMSSVPPQGLLGSAFGLAFSKPHLLGDLNRIMGGGQPQMETLRDAMFHETIELERLQRYYHLCQPESHRAIWDMSLFDLPSLSRIALPPMLVLGAEHDVLIPPDQVRMTARRYGVERTSCPTWATA
jgi:non-heme chloroperoxidase